MNDKQKRFAEEYLTDLNATQAAIRAGYSAKTAGSQGERLLKNDEIAAEITRLKQERSQRTNVTVDAVVQELALVAFSRIDDFASIEVREEIIPSFSWESEPGEEDPDEDDPEPETETRQVKYVDFTVFAKIPRNKKAAVMALKQGRYGVELKLHDKVSALELLGKHLGIFEKDNSQRKPDAAPFTDEQVDRLAAALKKS